MTMQFFIVILVVAVFIISTSGESSCFDAEGNEVVWLAKENNSNVIQVDDVRYLRSGKSVIGAQFTSEIMKEATAFTAFVVMETACDLLRFKDSTSASFLQIGMGIGAVPMHVHKHCRNFERVDVVEYDAAVVDFAKRFFGYNAGLVTIQDGKQYYWGDKRNTYDVVSQDVFMGWNPSHMISLDVFQQVKDYWLTPESGVFVMNFVGYLTEENQRNQFSIAVVRTLANVFKHVKCYPDVPPNTVEDLPTNIICFSSDSPIEFHIVHDSSPIADQEYSMPWIFNNFQQWQVFREVTDVVDDQCSDASADCGVPILQSEQDYERYSATLQALQEDMWKQVKPMFPDCAWEFIE